MDQTKFQIQQRTIVAQANMYQLQQEELGLRNMWQVIQGLEQEQAQALQSSADKAKESPDSAPAPVTFLVAQSTTKAGVQQRIREIQASLYQLQQEELGLRNMIQAVDLQLLEQGRAQENIAAPTVTDIKTPAPVETAPVASIESKDNVISGNDVTKV